MLVLVGLGNPGAQYSGHRHNIGFMAVDAIADHFNFDAPRAKFNGTVQEGYIEQKEGGRTKTIILKPHTYMNDSGKSVAALARFYKIAPQDIIVFHDELDIAPGKVRTKQGGGHAGHNGLRSIDSHIGKDFIRIRIGIGHPGSKAAVHNYVLGNFAKAESQWVERILDAMARSAPFLADHENKGLERFQSEVAHQFQPNTHSSPKTAPKGGSKKPSTSNENNKAPKSNSGTGTNTNDGNNKGNKKDKKTVSFNPFHDALKKILPGKDENGIE